MLEIFSNKQLPTTTFLFVIALLAFSPPIAYIFSIIGMFAISNYKIRLYEPYFIVFGFGAIFSIVISGSSHPLFLYEESDFTTYYNNYHDFLEYGFRAEFFKFGKGVEVGLPLVNYFLSLLINEPLPYLVRAAHLAFQMTLLVFLVKKIVSFHKLDKYKAGILLALFLLFFKFGATLNHLRQGYSSFFILIALFSTKRMYLYFILACLFHVSALVIYPLCNFLLKNSNKKFLIIFIISILFGSVGILIVLEVIADFIKSSDLAILGKLVVAFSTALDQEDVVLSFKRSLIASMYFIPIVALSNLLFVLRRKHLDYELNVWAMFIFVMGFSYIPVISTRILAPIITVCTGYLYFRAFVLDSDFRQLKYLVIFFICFFNINWIFSSSLHYYRYPMASVIPFYYLNSLFEVRENVNRFTLPSEHDKPVENPYR